MSQPHIPEASVARLPLYLRVLVAMAEDGVATVSSGDLARDAGVNSAKIRKDLSHLGSYGTRGVGYDVEYLIAQITRELGMDQEWATVLVGAGNLGQALANYGGFSERGFRMMAILDSDPAKVGQVVAGLRRAGVVPEQAGSHHLPGCVEQHHTVHVPGDADGLHRAKVVGEVVQHLCAGGDPVGGILLGPARGRAGAVQRSGGNGNHAVALVEQQRLQS